MSSVHFAVRSASTYSPLCQARAEIEVKVIQLRQRVADLLYVVDTNSQQGLCRGPRRCQIGTCLESSSFGTLNQQIMGRFVSPSLPAREDGGGDHRHPTVLAKFLVRVRYEALRQPIRTRNTNVTFIQWDRPIAGMSGLRKRFLYRSGLQESRLYFPRCEVGCELCGVHSHFSSQFQ